MTTPVEVVVDPKALTAKRGHAWGHLQMKLGTDLFPALPKDELVALLCASLMQAAVAVVSEETERAPAAFQRSDCALLIENAGAGRLDLFGFALGRESRQTGHWQVNAREFVQALMNGADQILRMCVYHEWHKDDVSMLIHCAITAKQWLGKGLSS